MKPATNDLRTAHLRDALVAIATQHGGVLNPHAVVDAARLEGHPLHDHFEWDDTTAAEAYRLAQAGALIRRVRLTILRQPGTTREVNVGTTRAFQSRPSQRTADGGYESVSAILTDATKRGELLQVVLRDLQSYRRRYAELIELQDVWAAVDDVALTLIDDEPPSDHPSDAPPAV